MIRSNTAMRVTYDNMFKDKVLDSFGLKAQGGVIVDKETGIKVPDNLGSSLTSKKFGGIRKGSFEFINTDVASLIRLRKKLKNK